MQGLTSALAASDVGCGIGAMVGPVRVVGHGIVWGDMCLNDLHHALVSFEFGAR